MGAGDALMGSGMAKGAASRGKKIAFGNGQRIFWDQNSDPVFRGNPNIARPGMERLPNLEWIDYYKGHRVYNKVGANRWIWNYEFKAQPGQIFLSREERKSAEKFGSGFVVMEPNVPQWKSVAKNKQWPVDRYDEVSRRLLQQGVQVVQLGYVGATHRLKGTSILATPSFRAALAVLGRAALYIGPEGGMHHGSASEKCDFNDSHVVNKPNPAVVIFGGFIPPQVTGYDTHTNLTGGAEACGSFGTCSHCAAAMDRITVEEVVKAAEIHLEKVAA